MSLNIQNKDFLQGLSCAPFHGLPGPPESTGHSGRRPWLYSLTHMGLVYAEQAGPCRLPLLPPVAGDSVCRQDLLLCLADGGYPDLGAYAIVTKYLQRLLSTHKWKSGSQRRGFLLGA